MNAPISLAAACRAWALFLVALGVASLALGCGDTKAPGASTGASSCLETPAGLPLPPTGELPCELLPPGFSRLRGM